MAAGPVTLANSAVLAGSSAAMAEYMGLLQSLSQLEERATMMMPICSRGPALRPFGFGQGA